MVEEKAAFKPPHRREGEERVGSMVVASQQLVEILFLHSGEMIKIHMKKSSD
jgi:hypothetical protein